MESMSPIPSLPTEIVIKILSTALRRAIDDNEPTTTSLLNFCLVSRRWRDVVQTASELWTDIDLHWPIEQQRTWVEQSAPRGIDVHALMEPEDHFEIIKHPSRLRSLRLLSVPLGYLEQFLGSIEGSNLDKLESIHLGCDACSTGMAVYELPPDFPARTPCLRAISLSALRIANLHIVAHQLTHLEIFRSTHTSEDLMQTLSLCVNLEYLSLGGLSVHGPYKQGPVIMPRLRTLLLHPYNTTYCVQLILGISRFGPPARHLRAPQLLCFYLWYNGECDVCFTDAISDFTKESPLLNTLGIAGHGPIAALANLVGMGCPPTPPVALPSSSEMDSGSDHFDAYGTPTPMQCKSQHSDDTLLVPRVRHFCLDLFVPVYKVTPGDRYHSLVTRFLRFRASVRDEKTGRPALRRLTLQGWSDQGLAEVVASYGCNDIIIDANMSGGLLPMPVE